MDLRLVLGRGINAGLNVTVASGLRVTTNGKKIKIIKEETMEMIKEAIEQLWKDHRKVCIGAGVVIVLLIILI